MNLPKVGKVMVLNDLHRFLNNSDQHYLAAELEIWLERNCKPFEEVLTRTFSFDGCSRFWDKWWRFQRVGKWMFWFKSIDMTYACFIHDVRYFMGGQEIDRMYADGEFRLNLIKSGLSRWKSYLMFRAVRIFGKNHFKKGEGRWT